MKFGVMGKYLVVSVGVCLMIGKYVFFISIIRKYLLNINVFFLSVIIDYELIFVKDFFYRNWYCFN